MKTHTFRSKPEIIAILVIAFFCFMAANCHSNVNGADKKATPKDGAQIPQSGAKMAVAANTTPADTAKVSTTIANAATILARKEVPILCYHQIRDYRPTDSKVAMTYIVPPAAFHEQIKVLADSGYHTILPDQLFDYLAYGKPLPPKPVMLTYDDTDLDQYTWRCPK